MCSGPAFVPPRVEQHLVRKGRDEPLQRVADEGDGHQIGGGELGKNKKRLCSKTGGIDKILTNKKKSYRDKVISAKTHSPTKIGQGATDPTAQIKKLNTE